MNQVKCPYCQATMTSRKPLPAGKAIRCLRCQGQFTIRQPDPDTLVSVPFQPPRRPSRRTTWLALGGLLFLLVYGAGLTIYCLSLPGNAKLAQGKGDDSDDFELPDPEEGMWGELSEKHHGDTENKHTKNGKSEVIAVKPPPPKFKEPAWVRKAIADGVKFLRARVQGAGKWSAAPNPLGYAALTGLALLECDVPPTDPLIQAARREVLGRVQPAQATYELSLAILFLDRLGKNEDEDLIRRLTIRLVAGQNPDGGWTYVCPILADPDQQNLLRFLKADRLQLDDLVRPAEFQGFISGKKGKLPAFKEKPKRPEPQMQAKDLPPGLAGLPVVKQAKPSPGQPNGVGGRSDNSNSQFAMLALWVAQNHGVPMERTYNLVDQRYRSSQSPEGWWSYTPDSWDTKPAMTCAGLLGLAVGHGSAQQVALRTADDAPSKAPSVQDPALQKGLKFLGECIGQPIPNPNVYFLWSVERVAVLYHLDTIGGKDWYTWGAKALLASQHEDGSWNAANTYPGANPTIDTCFALLFLKKANFVPNLTANLREYLRVRDPLDDGGKKE